MLAIINANVVTMEETDYPNGYVLVDRGKIKAVGGMQEFGDECKIIDAKGEYLFPGMVDPHCHVGMWEECVGPAGEDGNEDTDPVTPHLRALDAINPADRAFADAYSAGVTTVVTGPGSANVFGGQFAAVKTFGKRIDDMVVRAPAAQKLALGENPKSAYGEKHRAPSTRMATAAILRETLFLAAEYHRAKEEYKKEPQKNPRPPFDMKLESLLPLLSGEIPAKVHAHRADDIFTALRIAEEFGIRVTLEHCTEGHLISKYLKGHFVVTGPAFNNRSKPELANLSFGSPAVLAKAGAVVAVMTDHPEVPVQYLPLCAAMAVRGGMAKRDALHAVTINAARCCGIADRVGSIRPGKDADLILASKSLLDFEYRPTMVMINGVVMR